ncbi:MAG: glutathione S-transferase family protein [Wenzhouxiangellaceae bacterium]
MRLFTCSTAPSPRRVTLYLAEKGIELETVEVDLAGGEHLSDEFAARSPDCTVPVLELDDGYCFWNTLAIRRYLEDLYPDPPLLGGDAKSRSEVLQRTMWVEHNGLLAAAEAFRNASRGMKNHAVTGRRPMPQIAELAERGRTRFGWFLSDLNALLDTRRYLAGDAFSAADIDALVTLEFGLRATKAPTDGLDSLNEWLARVRQRPAIQG